MFAGSRLAARRALEQAGGGLGDDEVYDLARQVDDFASQVAPAPRPSGAGEPLSASLASALKEQFAVLNTLQAPWGGSQAQALGISTDRFAEDFTFGFVASVQRAPALVELADRLGDATSAAVLDLREQVSARPLEDDLRAAIAQAQPLQARLDAAGEGHRSVGLAGTRSGQRLRRADRVGPGGERAQWRQRPLP